MNWLIQHGKRIARITAGAVVLMAGIFLMLPGVPGPGFVLVFIGLSILAVDFVWARRLKRQLKSKAGRAMRKMRGQPAKNGAPAEKG